MVQWGKEGEKNGKEMEKEGGLAPGSISDSGTCQYLTLFLASIPNPSTCRIVPAIELAQI